MSLLYIFPLTLPNHTLYLDGRQEEPTIILHDNSTEEEVCLFLATISQNQDIWLKQTFCFKEKEVPAYLVSQIVEWAHFVDPSTNRLQWDLATDLFWRLKH